MNDSECIQEFQRRRRMYFRIGMPGILVAVCGFAAFYLRGDIPCADSQKALMGNLIFAAIIAGIVWWTVVTYLIYRCPACNSVPMAELSKGVMLDPLVCPKCGRRLKK